MTSERETETANKIFELSKEMGINNVDGMVGNELELIGLVRNCKFLYDRQQPDFKDLRMKNAAWCAIANVMNVSVTNVQSRWRSLREGYNKHKKDIKSTANDEQHSVWPYYEEMKFIEPYIKARSISNWQPTHDRGIYDDEIEELPENTLECAVSFEDIVKFIAEIQKRPILYDNKNINYKNKKLKFHHWKEVALICKRPVRECTHKWKQLREKYGRARRIIMSGQNEGRVWELYHFMSFLDNIVKKRNRQSRIYMTQSETANMDVVDIKTEIDGAIILKPEDISSSDIDNAIDDAETVKFIVDNANNSSLSSYSSTSENVLQNIRVLNYSASQTSSMTQTDSQNDDDDLFGQLIAAELKNMPRSTKKMKLKLDMFKLLCDQGVDM